MRIKCHELLNPNDRHGLVDQSESDNREIQDAISVFILDEKIWRLNIAKELNTTPNKLRWHPVPNTGTDIDICDITGVNSMCDTWELKL